MSVAKDTDARSTSPGFVIIGTSTVSPISFILITMVIFLIAMALIFSMVFSREPFSVLV